MGSPPPPPVAVSPVFVFYHKKEADDSPQIRMGALRLKLQANKWICSPSRQPLIVFHKGKMQFVSFLGRTSEGSGPCAMTHCGEKHSVSNRRKSDLSSVCSFLFYISICLIRPWAVTVNGQRNSDSDPSRVVSLSINDIICPRDVSVSLCLSHRWHSEGEKKKKTKRKEKRNVCFLH